MTELVEGDTKMEARGHIVRREVNRGTPKFLKVLQMSEADADEKGYQLYPVAGWVWKLTPLKHGCQC